MKKLLLLALLFISCKSVTSVNTRLDGTYCIAQLYYRTRINGHLFEAMSTRKTTDSRFCITFASFDDSTGALKAIGQYSIWADSGTTDSVLYQILYQQEEYGFYQKINNNYYLGFPAGGEWLSDVVYSWNGSNVFSGVWSYNDSTESDTLEVTFKK